MRKMIHFTLSYEELLNDKMQIIAAGLQAGNVVFNTQVVFLASS